jgi:hypothetical protein
MRSERAMFKSATKDETESTIQHAKKLARDGATERRVKAELVSRGLATDTAEIVAMGLGDLHTMRLEAKSKGREKMIHGALWCAGGAALMATTYLMVDARVVLILAWGAVGFGAVNFLLGLIRYVFALNTMP